MSPFALEPTAAQHAAEQACARLTSAFAFLVDHQRYDELMELFTEDCVFDRPGVLLKGRDQLRSFMQARPAGAVSRHVCTRPVLDEVGPDTAKGVTYLTFFDGEPFEGSPAGLKGVTAIAEYHDEFRRTSEGWRIARRQVVPIMIQR